jgi:hypothetical protein
MINRYRTFSTTENRNLRPSLLLGSQGVARFGKALEMILCVDGMGIGHLQPAQAQYWLNGKATAIVEDSPRFVDSFTILVSDANGEPSRAWSQGKRRKWGRIRPQ